MLGASRIRRTSGPTTVGPVDHDERAEQDRAPRVPVHDLEAGDRRADRGEHRAAEHEPADHLRLLAHAIDLEAHAALEQDDRDRKPDDRGAGRAKLGGPDDVGRIGPERHACAEQHDDSRHLQMIPEHLGNNTDQHGEREYERGRVEQGHGRSWCTRRAFASLSAADCRLDTMARNAGGLDGNSSSNFNSLDGNADLARGLLIGSGTCGTSLRRARSGGSPLPRSRAVAGWPHPMNRPPCATCPPMPGSCWSSMTSRRSSSRSTKIFAREGLNVLSATDGNAGARHPAQAPRRRAAHRSDDAEHERHGPAPRRQDDRARDRGRADDRVRHGRDRGRRDEGRRVRLRDEAAQARARRADRPQRAREAVAARREPQPQGAARREAPPRDHRHVSLAWRRTMDIVMQAAPSEATVLLLGESGTGKELLARALHEQQRAREGPVRRGQLRRDPRVDPRGRAVRLREGRVHRRRRPRATAGSRPRTAARCSSTRSARSAATCR